MVFIVACAGFTRVSREKHLKPLCDKREQLWFLNWVALTPALSQREREKNPRPREAAAPFHRGPSAAMACVGFLNSPLAVPRSAGRGAGAQRSMRASCSDLLRLSERSAQREASSAAPPHDRASQVAPKGTRPVGSPFSLVTFFLARQKESNCAAGRTSRPAAPPTPQTHQTSIAVADPACFLNSNFWIFPVDVFGNSPNTI